MALNKEIERKWIVDKDKLPFCLEECDSVEMKQAYICFSPTVRVRAENDSRFILCVKTKPAPGAIARDEFECEISESEYNSLLKKAEGIVVEKTRYYKTDENGYRMEIDIFKGVLEGLCYMEVEFGSEAEALVYRAPEWAVKDVTNDKRCKNAALAKYGKLVLE